MISEEALNAPHPKPLLVDAWERQIVYSINASRYQKRFTRLRTLTAFLSVGVVLFSIIHANLPDSVKASQPAFDLLNPLWILNNILIILPITITALLAFSVKFDRGQNWVLLRGNAEALKMEIYYYRTQVGSYKKNRDAVLAQRIKRISEGMKGSPVHHASLNPYERLSPTEKKQADLYDPKKYSDFISVEDYITHRLEEQFDWYRRRAKSFDRQLQFFQAGIYLFGGVGTFLAASEQLQSWVAVTTALTGAFSNFIEFKRVETTLVGYNQAADALYDIRTWWHSLSAIDQKNRKNFEKLVISTEETIRSENTSWLQDMQDLLADLYGAKEADEQDQPTESHTGEDDDHLRNQSSPSSEVSK